MILTREYIEANKTPAGAWTRSQMRAIGVEWPQAKGWINRVIGNEISEENAMLFEAKKTANQVKVSKMSPEGMADSMLSKRHLLSDKKLTIVIMKLQEEADSRMDNPRGGACTESSHKVKTLETAKEWFEGAKESDLPMGILQWKTPNGRICAIFTNSRGERIGSRG